MKLKISLSLWFRNGRISCCTFPPLLFLSSNQKWKTRRIVAASNPCASRPELNMHERVRLISVSLLKIIQPADYRSPVVDCALCATNPRTKYRPVVRRIRFQSASSSPSTSSSFSFDRAYIVAVQLFTNWRGSPILSIVLRDLSRSLARSLARSHTHTFDCGSAESRITNSGEY